VILHRLTGPGFGLLYIDPGIQVVYRKICGFITCRFFMQADTLLLQQIPHTMKPYISAVLSLMVCISASAMNPGNEQPSLDEQFSSIRQQTEVIEQFRMVKVYQVENFWKTVKDTIRQKDAAMAEIKQKISSFDAELQSLKATIDQKDQAMASLEFAGIHITFLGMDIRKESFIYTMAGIFLMLLALTVMAIFAFKMSYSKARESQNLYDDVYKEFETYKQRMVEKEIKILRELQDYRNRFVELKSA
jgi:hypothetical protein